MKCDVLIIGGGVTGSAIAWFLSRYDLSLLLVEKEAEICEGTSKANSGIVHAGYDPVSNSLKAKLNVRGNELIRKLHETLGYDFIQNGSLVVAFSKEETKTLEELRDQGLKNGVHGQTILTRDDLLEREKNLSKDAYAALYLPTGGIICPFSLTYAFAENAVTNGATIKTNSEVTSIEKKDKGYLVKAGNDIIEANVVINAAGVYADRINDMAGGEHFNITPRRGEYVLLDKSEGDFVHSTVFQIPTPAGKGVLVTPTVHGNLLVGPDSVDVDDRERTRTDASALDFVMTSARKSAPGLRLGKTITSFAGLRAHPDDDDFIINMPKPGFFNVAGIESPGLTASPAIGEMVGEMVAEYLKAKKKASYIEERKPIVKASSLSTEERNKLIASNPSYGNIICRCEEISEGEIVEAIRRGATTLDGVKRRVRAGMGRCQAGFCMPRVMELLSRELNIPMEEVRKNGKGSGVLV